MPKTKKYESATRLNIAEITAIKKDLGWGWSEFATYLGITVAALTNIKKVGVTDMEKLGRIVRMSEMAGRGGKLDDIIILGNKK